MTADALSRQAKMLAELRRGHARDWRRPPGDGLAMVLAG